MRTITFIGTVVAGLTAATFFAVPASAERICSRVCDGGICRSHCAERGIGIGVGADRDDRRLFLYHRDGDDRRFDRDRDDRRVHHDGDDRRVRHDRDDRR